MAILSFRLADVGTRTELAAKLGVPVRALDLVTLTATPCRRPGCSIPAANNNFHRCIMCQQTFFPREFKADGSEEYACGFGLFGPQFLREYNGSVSSKACCCKSFLCRKIGYSHVGMMSLPSKSERLLLLKAVEALGISDPKQRQQIAAKPSSYKVAPWHYKPEHRSWDAGRGKWKLRKAEDDGKKCIYIDSEEKLWDFPPPNYKLELFIENEIPSIPRGGHDDEDALPDWAKEVAAAQGDGQQNNSTTPGSNSTSDKAAAAIRSHFVPDPHCETSKLIHGDEATAGMSLENGQIASKIETFLLGRIPGSNSASYRDSPQEQIRTNPTNETTKGNPREGKEESVNLPADPAAAMACAHVFENQTANNSAGNGDKNALVEANATIKTVQIDRKSSKIYNLGSLCKSKGCQNFRNWKSDGFCVGCFNARRDGRSIEIDESVEEAQKQHIKNAAAAQAAAESVEKSQNRQRRKPVVAVMAEDNVVAEAKEMPCRPPKIEWQTHFDSYVAHLKRNGAGVDVAWKDNPKLYNWIRHQRGDYRDNSLDESRVIKLREVGFDFNASKWRTCFQRLSQHVAEHGAIPGSVKAEELVSRRWWKEQLKKRERGDLSDEQLGCLRDIENQLHQPFQKRPYKKRRKKHTMKEEGMPESDDQMHAETDDYDKDEKDEKSPQLENDSCDEQLEEEEKSNGVEEQTELDDDVASSYDQPSNIHERLNSIEGGVVAGITLGQESAHWETFTNALDAYVQQYGHPPQTRDESPALFDWLQLQKERHQLLLSFYS